MASVRQIYRYALDMREQSTANLCEKGALHRKDESMLSSRVCLTGKAQVSKDDRQPASLFADEHVLALYVEVAIAAVMQEDQAAENCNADLQDNG
jgi:hypothetical protein